MKEFKKLVLVISMLLMTSCGLQLQIGSANINTSKTQKVKVYTTTFQTIKNLDPHHFGLHIGGDWIHCRTHGFHDLNDWTDFTYSPYFCRVTDGFLSGASWNSAWTWNRNRWSIFGYDRLGYNNQWTNSMYYGWNNYYNQGWPYYGNNVYGNRYGRNRERDRNSYYGRRTITPKRTRTITPVRTRTITPKRTRTNSTRRVIKNTKPSAIRKTTVIRSSRRRQ